MAPRLPASIGGSPGPAQRPTPGEQPSAGDHFVGARSSQTNSSCSEQPEDQPLGECSVGQSLRTPGVRTQRTQRNASDFHSDYTTGSGRTHSDVSDCRRVLNYGNQTQHDCLGRTRCAWRADGTVSICGRRFRHGNSNNVPVSHNAVKLSASRVRSVASSASKDQLFEMFVSSVAITTETTNIYLILMTGECIYLRGADRAWPRQHLDVR